MTDWFLTNGQTGFLEGRIFKQTISKEVFNGFKKTVFWQIVLGKFLVKFWSNFRQLLGFFGTFWQFLGKFLANYFVRTVNFDCGADLSAVRLEINTICHDGQVYGSIRWRLSPPLVSLNAYEDLFSTAWFQRDKSSSKCYDFGQPPLHPLFGNV